VNLALGFYDKINAEYARKGGKKNSIQFIT
jgi:hypothetical protein